MSMVAILVLSPGPFEQTFAPPPILRSLHVVKFEFNWPSGFRGEDLWKCWRTTGAGVIGILLAHLGAFGSGELKCFITFVPVLG